MANPNAGPLILTQEQHKVLQNISQIEALNLLGRISRAHRGEERDRVTGDDDAIPTGNTFAKSTRGGGIYRTSAGMSAAELEACLQFP